MQLPSSTLPSDPNLAALLFPAATTSSPTTIPLDQNGELLSAPFEDMIAGCEPVIPTHATSRAGNSDKVRAANATSGVPQAFAFLRPIGAPGQQTAAALSSMGQPPVVAELKASKLESRGTSKPAPEELSLDESGGGALRIENPDTLQLPTPVEAIAPFMTAQRSNEPELPSDAPRDEHDTAEIAAPEISFSATQSTPGTRAVPSSNGRSTAPSSMSDVAVAPGPTPEAADSEPRHPNGDDVPNLGNRFAKEFNPPGLAGAAYHVAQNATRGVSRGDLIPAAHAHANAETRPMLTRPESSTSNPGDFNRGNEFSDTPVRFSAVGDRLTRVPIAGFDEATREAVPPSSAPDPRVAGRRSDESFPPVPSFAPARGFRDHSGTGFSASAIAPFVAAFKQTESRPANSGSESTDAITAKIAAAEFAASGSRESGRNGPDKSFLTTADASLANQSPAIGTAVANVQPAMPLLPNGLQPHPVSEYAGELLPASAGSGELRAELPAATTEAVRSAHEAVETVLQAADRVASRDQRSVNLDFSVGDAKLAVRVELQGGEVRTTFRTDSPELRSALAQEWEGVAGGSENRTFRLAPPVITGADFSARNDTFGDSLSRQHEREPRHAESQRESVPDRRRRADPQPAAAVVSRAPQFLSSTARHLQIFA